MVYGMYSSSVQQMDSHPLVICLFPLMDLTFCVVLIGLSMMNLSELGASKTTFFAEQNTKAHSYLCLMK